MIRSYAASITAQMVEGESVRNWADQQYVCGAVGAHVTSKPESSVPIRGDVREPVPAPVGLIDLRPESRQHRSAHRMHCIAWNPVDGARLV